VCQSGIDTPNVPSYPTKPTLTGVDFSMTEWTPFRKVSDRPSAEALAELLLTRGVPARIEERCLLPGVDGYFAVVIPTELLHRARWTVPELPFDERELTWLATGEFDPN
jgi:hypothetical protein